MKRTSGILLGLGSAMAIIALAAPSSHSQCTTSREFGGQGNGSLTGRIAIDTGTFGFPNDGNEFISLWDTANGSATFGSGDHVPTNPGACPGWYVTGGMFLGRNSGIQGYIGTPGCFPVQCPAPAELISTLVEDSNGSDAGFILYTVEATPGNIRYYDHARTAGIDAVPGGVGTQTFRPYPELDVTGSHGPPPDTTTTSNYLDLALNFHGAGATSAASTGIQSYDIVAHQGLSSPGRLRSAYNMGVIKQIPYADAGIFGDQIAVPCPVDVNDTFLAVGATFVDPSTGGLPSIYVGRNTIVECDPNIADPDDPTIRRRTRPLGRGGR